MFADKLLPGGWTTGKILSFSMIPNFAIISWMLPSPLSRSHVTRCKDPINTITRIDGKGEEVLSPLCTCNTTAARIRPSALRFRPSPPSVAAVRHITSLRRVRRTATSQPQYCRLIFVFDYFRAHWIRVDESEGHFAWVEVTVTSGSALGKVSSLFLFSLFDGIVAWWTFNALQYTPSRDMLHFRRGACRRRFIITLDGIWSESKSAFGLVLPDCLRTCLPRLAFLPADVFLA